VGYCETLKVFKTGFRVWFSVLEFMVKCAQCKTTKVACVADIVKGKTGMWRVDVFDWRKEIHPSLAAQFTDVTLKC